MSTIGTDLQRRTDSARSASPRARATLANPIINVAENLGRYLSCTKHTVQGKGSKLILTVKMETRHPIEWPFGREFPTIYNRCGVMTAWSRKTWKFCEQLLRVLEKRSLSNCRSLRWSRPKSARASLPHLAHIVPDFIQMGSLSVELLPNAWRPFLPRVDYLQ